MLSVYLGRCTFRVYKAIFFNIMTYCFLSCYFQITKVGKLEFEVKKFSLTICFQS